ncbi:MAG: cell division protein FtsZ [Marinilabiliales bacterium]|nr:MAG: cell division protein FtsZ [Marinilabiliales bacterium]
MSEIINFDLPVEHSSIIKVVGVGGGGSNAVNHMFRMGIKDVNFVVCNTDSQALQNSEVPIRIQLGESLTEGRGAGNKPEIGKQAAIENLDDVIEALSGNTKMVFITAGMGGGTGTGAAPVIARAAKEMGLLTVAIVTIPFRFEGKVRINQAIDGINELRSHVDSLLVINNEKLREIYGDLKISEAFSRADDVLTGAAKGIAEIITVHGHVNVDFADVQTVMLNSGVAILGSGTAEGEGRAIKAIQAAISSPLLNNNDIRGASNILLNITSGTDEVSMDEVGEITDFVTAETEASTNIIWGTCSEASLGQKISVTIIATGFETNSIPELYSRDRGVEKLKLADFPSPDKGAVVGGFTVKEKSRKSPNSFEFDKLQRTIEFDIKGSVKDPGAADDEGHAADDLSGLSGMRTGDRASRLKEAGSRLKEKNYLNVNEKEEIEELERQPAFERKKISLNFSKRSSGNPVSRYTLSEDGENGPKFRADNGYLHDNVD